MALNLGGLPYFTQYEQQAQQARIQQQEAGMRMLAFQQQQQQQARQQAAMQAAGRALPQLLAPPPAQQSQIPAPQPPMPGQPSQPMTQPGAVPPPPQGAAPAPQAQPAPMQPYRALPTTPPPQQAQGSGMVPPPPQTPAASAMQQPGGPLSFERAIQTLRAQGLEGADLMAGLAQLQPVLDTQAKLQNAQLQQQFKQEVALAQIEDRRAALKERHDEALQRAEDRKLDRADRAAARAESNAIRREMLALRVQAAQGNPDAKLDKETLKAMAQQYVAAPDQSMFTNLGRGAQGAGNVIALRKAIQEEAKAQGLSPAEMAAKGIAVGGEKAAARTAGTAATNVALAAGEAAKTFPLVKQYSDAIPRTEIPALNKLIDAAQTGTGDPRWVQLGAAITTAANAYARGINPKGTPTVSDKEHAREVLHRAMTQGQTDAVLKVWQQEMAAAQAAPAEVMAKQRERISGKGEGAPAGGIPAGWTVKEH